MRRAAVTHLLLTDADFQRKTVTVEKKGGVRHAYQISKEGLDAISDCLDEERPADVARWHSPVLFFASKTIQNTGGSLSVRTISQIWDEVCVFAGVEGKTPHSARHALGRHIIGENGQRCGVQRRNSIFFPHGSSAVGTFSAAGK
jgi:site-specific recombinase XerD